MSNNYAWEVSYIVKDILPTLPKSILVITDINDKWSLISIKWALEDIEMVRIENIKYLGEANVSQIGRVLDV